MISSRLALYTTIYPGAEPFLRDWYASVLEQTDRDFDLWIGLDSLRPDDVAAVLGVWPRAHWVLGQAGASPAQIRQQAIEPIVSRYVAVVLVDCDDVLDPMRVAADRRALTTWDVCASALRLIDAQGSDLDILLRPTVAQDADAFMPSANLFGLSNTSYRSAALRACLPIPADCLLVDWYLATRAWAAGAKLGFDHACRGAYRQHARNMARVLPPFTRRDVVEGTQRVLAHYACVLPHLADAVPARRQALRAAQQRTARFHEMIRDRHEGFLDRYVRAISRIPGAHPWWSWVAREDLMEA
jgi:hypothetical protein